MSWNHTTSGWDKLNSFLTALKEAGIKHTVEELPEMHQDGADDDSVVRHLRMVTFHASDGSEVYAREYLAIRDFDSDGTNIIDFKVFGPGEFPDFTTKLAEG